MKYIITDKNEVRIGNTYHYDLAKNCIGQVVRAGHISLKDIEVFGRSNTFNINSSLEDGNLIKEIDNDIAM